MKFLKLPRAFSSHPFIITNVDHTESLGYDFLMTQAPCEFRNHNPFWNPETEQFMHFTSCHLFHLQRILFHTTSYSRPICKANLLNELPQHFVASSFQKPDYSSKSYFK